MFTVCFFCRLHAYFTVRTVKYACNASKFYTVVIYIQVLAQVHTCTYVYSTSRNNEYVTRYMIDINQV